ncbi:hypothetical protein KL912_000560 [Ogataea haglerorum]|nr:hypothetical protein KL912_000560 [Ogataea haglerorum]
MQPESNGVRRFTGFVQGQTPCTEESEKRIAMVPSHTGNALLLKKRTDASTPAPKPRPDLTIPFEMTTSHLALTRDVDGEEVAISDICELVLWDGGAWAGNVGIWQYAEWSAAAENNYEGLLCGTAIGKCCSRTTDQWWWCRVDNRLFLSVVSPYPMSWTPDPGRIVDVPLSCLIARAYYPYGPRFGIHTVQRMSL